MSEFSLPHPLDSLNRSDYKNAAAYYEAAANLAVQRETPEFKKAYLKIQEEVVKRENAAMQAEIKAEINKMYAKTHLDEREAKTCKEQALAWCEARRANGSLSIEDFAGELERVQKEYEDKAKRRKAENAVVNSQIRIAMGRG